MGLLRETDADSPAGRYTQDIGLLVDPRGCPTWPASSLVTDDAPFFEEEFAFGPGPPTRRKSPRWLEEAVGGVITGGPGPVIESTEATRQARSPGPPITSAEVIAGPDCSACDP